MASKKEESEDRQGEHSALVAAEAVAKNAKSTKDREDAIENVVILETTATPTTKTSPSSQKSHWLEQQQQSVSRTLDETKENIIKATTEARKDIPRHTEVVNDYQEQTIEATKEIINNYLESQKEIINSFQSAWAPYLENVHKSNQYWISPLSPMTAAQAYIRMMSNFADNMIWGTRLASNTIFANMDAFKRTMQEVRDNSRELLRISVNTAKTFEHTSGDTTVYRRFGNGS
jgi:hypothetical protein